MRRASCQPHERLDQCRRRYTGGTWSTSQTPYESLCSERHQSCGAGLPLCGFVGLQDVAGGPTDFAALGTVMYAGAVGQMLIARTPAFAEGGIVLSNNGWREYFVSDGSGLERIEPVAPLSYIAACWSCWA